MILNWGKKKKDQHWYVNTEKSNPISTSLSEAERIAEVAAWPAGVMVAASVLNERLHPNSCAQQTACREASENISKANIFFFFLNVHGDRKMISLLLCQRSDTYCSWDVEGGKLRFKNLKGWTCYPCGKHFSVPELPLANLLPRPNSCSLRSACLSSSRSQMANGRLLLGKRRWNPNSWY